MEGLDPGKEPRVPYGQEAGWFHSGGDENNFGQESSLGRSARSPSLY